jgi:hypothetical protein
MIILCLHLFFLIESLFAKYFFFPDTERFQPVNSMLDLTKRDDKLTKKTQFKKLNQFDERL